MKLKWVILISNLFVLAIFTTGCSLPVCTAPSVNFADASKAAKGWVEMCLQSKALKIKDPGFSPRKYWTGTAGNDVDRACEFLGNLASEGISVISTDEPTSLMCMRQVYVTLKRGDEKKRGEKKGSIVFFVENGDPSSTGNAVLMGATFGSGCKLVDLGQEENRDYFDGCFWRPSQ